MDITREVYFNTDICGVREILKGIPLIYLSNINWIMLIRLAQNEPQCNKTLLLSAIMPLTNELIKMTRHGERPL